MLAGSDVSQNGTVEKGVLAIFTREYGCWGLYYYLLLGLLGLLR
jgi:hypothetical protein